MSATGKGLEWERNHTRWVWFTLPFLGYWTWAVFLYIGIRAQYKRWIFWGFAYLSPFVFALPFLPDWQQNGQLPIMPMLFFAACVVAGPIHAFRVRGDYLLRLAAAEQRKERQTQEQQNKREQERGVDLDGVRPKRNNTSKPQTNEPEVTTKPDLTTTVEPAPSVLPATPTLQEQPQPLADPEIAVSRGPVITIDINRDSAEHMAQLPEIGLILALKITQIREEHGAFHSFEEFAEVMEFSPRFAERLRPYLVF